MGRIGQKFRYIPFRWKLPRGRLLFTGGAQWGSRRIRGKRGEFTGRNFPGSGNPARIPPVFSPGICPIVFTGQKVARSGRIAGDGPARIPPYHGLRCGIAAMNCTPIPKSRAPIALATGGARWWNSPTRLRREAEFKGGKFFTPGRDWIRRVRAGVFIFRAIPRSALLATADSPCMASRISRKMRYLCIWLAFRPAYRQGSLLTSPYKGLV